MPNNWVEHVKSYATANKVTYKEALSKAKESYKKPEPDVKKSKPSKKVKKPEENI